MDNLLREDSDVVQAATELHCVEHTGVRRPVQLGLLLLLALELNKEGNMGGSDLRTGWS